MNRRLIVSLCAAPLLMGAGLVQGQVTLFDTGPTRPLMFDATNQGNYTQTYLGLGGGDLGPGLEQRWTAAPFSIPAGNWDITQIDANYFHSAGTPQEIGIRIWSRTGQSLPDPMTEVFAGSVPAPTLVTDPRITGGGLWLSILDVAGLNINLSGGDYYLNLYAIDNVANARVSWLLNAENGIPLIDPATNEPFLMRSSQYPTPGFGPETFPTTMIGQQPGLDPNDRFNVAFTVHGIPTPGSLAVLTFGALVACRRRR